MKKIKEIIIIGGGSSISKGISLGLIEKLKDKFVIACNYSFLHFPHTFLTCTDREFYQTTNLTEHPNISEQLKKEPLIITCMKKSESLVIHPNTILVKKNRNYNKNPLKEGFIWVLTGLFSLHLTELFEVERVFLLGFDYDKRNPEEVDRKNYNGYGNFNIHYYGDEIKHIGSKKVGFYENHNPNKYFSYFKKFKIYNVSLNSNIQNFEKINYPTMFKLLSNIEYNQEELKQEIKKKLI